MRASSSHCSARRSISAIRSVARRLASVTARPSVVEPCAVRRRRVRAPPALDGRQQFRLERRKLAQRRNLADAREVAEPARRGRQRAPRGEKRQLVPHGPALPDEGVRPERRFARRRRRAGGIGAGNAGDLRGDLGDARVEPVEPLPRRRDRRGPGVVGGFQIPLQASERRRRGSADGVGERPQRVAQAFEPLRTHDPVVGKRERGPAARSSGGPRGCRCPPPRHRAAAAASATACRTSCRNAPRAVPCAVIVRSAFAVRRRSCPAGM